MAGGLGEPAGERESFLGGGGAAATTVSPSSDPERETMPLGGGNSNSSSAANMRPRRRWKEDGLAEPLEESPNGARGERNRSESTTPGSRTRSTFESKTGTTASRGGLVSFPRLLSYLEACLRGPETTRISLAVLAVATLLSLTMAVGASVGLWSWSDIFPRKAYLFDVVRDCRKVRTGRGAPCSNVFESACFDRSRCAAADGGMEGGGGGTSLSVYVHDDKCSMKSSSEIVANYRGGAVPQMWSQAAEALRQVAASRELLVETPEQACIIVYGVPHEKECVSRTPTWGEGRNHLLLDMNDASRDAYPTLDDKAMFAESNMRPCYFRYGYDIALPLRARAFFYNLRGIAPQDRKYFATFKGSLYLSGNGLRERAAVRTVADTAADPTGVVVVEMCDRFHGEPERPRNVKLCQRLRRDYDKADYADLMNTTFALVPAGRSPATYRLGEALSAGAIPVFIHQDFVKPFPGRIPWHTFSFSFPAEEAPRIIDTLRTVSPRKLAKMQETALEVFDKFFGRGMNGIVGTTLDILEERLSFRGQRR